MAEEPADIDPAIAENDLAAEELAAAALAMQRVRIYRHNGGRFPQEKQVRVEPFDFRTPRFLAEPDISRLRTSHQQFVASLSGRIASFLRAEFNLRFAGLTTSSFADFTRSISSPTHLTLFKAEPLPGVAVLEIQPRLAIAMINRRLGGPGTVAEVDRHLTEIEIAILEDILAMVIEEWCQQWREYCNVEGSQIGHETSARFLQGMTNDSVMLVMVLEATFGGRTEGMQLAMPAHMLEPLMKVVKEVRSREIPKENPTKPKQWRAAYDHIGVPVVADWTVPGITVGDLLRLRVGDVLELPRTTIENTRVCVSNVPRFFGKAGCENSKVAVQIQREAPKNTAEKTKA